MKITLSHADYGTVVVDTPDGQVHAVCDVVTLVIDGHACGSWDGLWQEIPADSETFYETRVNGLLRHLVTTMPMFYFPRRRASQRAAQAIRRMVDGEATP